MLKPKIEINNALEIDNTEIKFCPLPPPLQNISFYSSSNGEKLGTLYMEAPMRFEGNVKESVKLFFERLFFEYLIKLGGNGKKC